MMALSFPFDNSYARLPERFYARVMPTPVQAPGLIRVNKGLAEQLRLDAAALASEEGVAVLAGNRVPEKAEPIALAYAGHQFGQFVPQLGDGRAVLLGEIVDRQGVRRDVQLKGAGRTPFSRGGDGRAPLGPVLREYLVSESMAALGIPTTRALAAVTTGEVVFREATLPGGVLTRVASSHVRVGTFQYFAARRDAEAIRLLADHVIARHYPDALEHDNPYLALLENVIRSQAQLISGWMLLGFIHGVMNTDNTSIAGETIDYGPCAFMDSYDPNTVFSSIDRNGRYAYAQQPAIGQWNLARFAECILPLLADDPKAAIPLADELLGTYGPVFQHTYDVGLGRKLGFQELREGDGELGRDLLRIMHEQGDDFTLTFRRLSEMSESKVEGSREESLSPGKESGPYGEWVKRWRRRLSEEPGDVGGRTRAMLATNPIYIPRNHLVENVIQAAMHDRNFEPFHELVEALQRPYEVRKEWERYASPPAAHERVLRTFCGT